MIKLPPAYKKEVPLNLYPRPQFITERWQCLNGKWMFAPDPEGIGTVKGYHLPTAEYPSDITVPYPYGSEAAGAGSTDLTGMWYALFFDCDYDPEDFGHILLRFGAADFFSYVFLNGRLLGSHIGGSTPFYFDVKGILRRKDNFLAVYIRDHPFDPYLTRGKQAVTPVPDGCRYPRLSGIWRTVWLEYLPEVYIPPESIIINTDSDGRITLSFRTEGFGTCGFTPAVELWIDNSSEDCGTEPSAVIIPTLSRNLNPQISTVIKNPVLWQPDDPHIYTARLKIINADTEEGDILHELKFYFGFISVGTENGAVTLNGRPFYIKSVLYQGFFRESLWSPPSYGHIKRDLELVAEMGFNHIRVHQIFPDPYLLYYADRMGITVWMEAPNALRFGRRSAEYLIKEWIDALGVFGNHPSIIGYVPINESWGAENARLYKERREFLKSVYYITKAFGRNLPVIDNDGWEHVITDIATIHLYREADVYAELPEELPPPNSEEYLKLKFFIKAGAVPPYVGDSVYSGEPIIISEWGGWAYLPPDKREGVPSNAWGYGTGILDSFDEVLEKYRKVLTEMAKRKWIAGYCYTQFCDQFQEINGLLTFDREPKGDPAKIRELNGIPEKYGDQHYYSDKG